VTRIVKDNTPPLAGTVQERRVPSNGNLAMNNPAYNTSQMSTMRVALPPTTKPLPDQYQTDKSNLQIRSDDQYVPPPLSPRRPLSPQKPSDRTNVDFLGSLAAAYPITGPNTLTGKLGHGRTSSYESNSWLDQTDESGDSTASSVHSRSSSMGVRRKHIRAASGDTEAEFDAALDAAVEAAYDDGYEPMEPDELQVYSSNDDVVANALRKVELAKERVRQSERETYELENERERRQMMRPQYETANSPEDFYDDNSSDEEERILEEMTRGYEIEDFTFRPQPNSSSQRHLDSNDSAPRTWQTSLPNTAGTTVMSNAGEAVMKNAKPLVLPPSEGLPELPSQNGRRAGQNSVNGTLQTVRNRRLSGQNPKQLKIETSQLGKPSSLSRNGIAEATEDRQTAIERPRTPMTDEISPTDEQSHSPMMFASHNDSEDNFIALSGSPTVPISDLRKNYSSSSLRSMKSRNMSLSNLDDASDLSPGTPLSIGPSGRLPVMPMLPTPLATTFREKMSGTAGTGLYLFDDNFHSPNSPGSPNPLLIDAPVALEPCPTDYMLRPFWLMRCLYQTLAHPRGGYLSNKLFVPRDVWKVKGVKLRNVEDKIANCDFLTAGLMKLAKVDTCDADAVLEEMQSFESILEQVQNSLTRKLGNEVGVQTSGNFFREATATPEIDQATTVPRSASVSAKSSFSWRRLKPKNSAAGLGSAYGNKSAAADGSKESLNLVTLPMTTHPTSRPSKRDVNQAQFGGPHANYMASLARLCDAAQTIGQSNMLSRERLALTCTRSNSQAG
jgi:hypothetical protein